jgi:hypothetical protein
MGNRAAISRVKGPTDPSAKLDYATRQYVDTAADTFLPVANGTHFNGNSGGTSTNLPQGRLFETRKLLRVISGGADTLQVEWANIWTSNTPQALDATCEMAGPNSVSVRMGIEYPAGNMRMTSGSSAWNSATVYAISDQVTSGGSSWVALAASTSSTPSTTNANWRKINRYLVRWENDDGAGTITFAAGDYKQSLPLALLEKMVLGDKVAILGTYDTGVTTNRVPYAGAAGACNTAPFVDWVVLNTTAMPSAGSAMADTGVTTQTNGNTTAANSTDNTAWMKIPYATALTGNIPATRCVALFGDSLVQGTGGDIRDGEPAGIFVRSVNGSTWWRIAQSGNQASCYTLTNAPWQMSCVARCTSVLTDLGLNDIQAANSFAIVQARMLRLWNALAAQGVPVYTGLLTPISLSTDSWATTANQSRWTTGGVSAFPADDASYLTSVYGQIQLWLGQDGASITVDGNTTKIGNCNHPLRGIYDWRSLLSDPQTSWKWTTPGKTTDGAHPVASAAIQQAGFLAGQLDALIMGRTSIAFPNPAFRPAGESIIENFPRSMAVALSPAITGNGSLMSVIGVSSGKDYLAVRLYSGTATAKAVTVLAGLDPTKMKVIGSGATAASVGFQIVTLNGGATTVWIPAGHLVAVVGAAPALSSWGGSSVLALGTEAQASAMHKTQLNYALAGISTNTVALTGTVSIFATTSGSNTFLVHSFRMWADLL